MFNTTNFPGASATNLAAARGLYATLVGRVTAISASSVLSETTNQYTYLGPNVQRFRQRELGAFAQDAWRVNSNLTLNYGLRWEVQLPFVALNDVLSQTTFDELFGISGPGGLFKPGASGGKVTTYNQFKSSSAAYNTDYTNFAPSFGLAWSPNFKSSLGKFIFGDGGQTVFRGGYSIAYNREGMNVFSSIYASNPGLTIDASRNLTLNNLGTLPILFRNKNQLAPPSFPTTPIYPNEGLITNSANAFNPDLKIGYVQSWSFGIQREINRDTAIEVRYVANRGVKLWQQYNLNETNFLENGFLNEFKLAQANLAANIAGGRGNTFKYAGPNTGTVPLPIMLAFFSGVAAANAGDPARYTSTQFGNATFVNALAVNGPSMGTFSGNFTSNATFRGNGLVAGLPANFFLLNPGKLGGAWSIENNGRTWYDSIQVELRRRLSRGLLVQGNYVFSRAFTNAFASSSAVAGQPSTLRDFSLSKTLSPFAVIHAIKANWIWELPFGKNQLIGGGAGALFSIASSAVGHSTAQPGFNPVLRSTWATSVSSA